MPNATRSALVIGGGFSGMTAAIEMRKSGMAVDLVEIDPGWRSYGAGISLGPATLRLFDRIGILDRFLECGAATDAVEIYTASGHQIAKLPTPRLAREDVPAGGGIMRPALARILSELVLASGTQVRLGQTFTDIAERDGGVFVTLSDGSTRKYDVVVGADGLYSKLRQALFPDAPKPGYVGQSVWRAVLPRPPDVHGVRMWIGSKVKVGVNPTSADQMYMFITEDRPTNAHVPPETHVDCVKQLLSQFSAPLLQKIRGEIGPEHHVVYRPLEQMLLPRPWRKGCVVLIGDAVHATTPHLAAGACIGMEDGYVLAQELAKPVPVETALHAFEERRWERCRMVVENSNRLAQIEISNGAQAEHAELMKVSSMALAAPIEPASTRALQSHRPTTPTHADSGSTKMPESPGAEPTPVAAKTEADAPEGPLAAARFGTFGVLSLLIAHCAGMIDLVALPIWVGALVANYKFSPQQAGGLATAFLAGAVMASLLFAPLFHRLNPRLLAAIGFLVAAAAFAAAAQTTDFMHMLGCHALAGVSAGTALSMTHGTIGRAPNAHRLFAFAGMALGLFAIVVLGGAPQLMLAKGAQTLFVIFAAVMAFAGIVAAFAFPRVAKVVASPGRAKFNASVWMTILGIGCMALNQAMVFSFFEVIGRERGFDSDAILSVLIALGIINFVIPAPTAALLQKRLAATTVTRVGPLVQALLAIAVTVSPQFHTYAVAGAFFTAVMIFTHTFAFGLLSELEPTGRAVAGTPAMLMVGAAIGPVLGGILTQNIGFPALGATALVVAAIAIFFFSRARAQAYGRDTRTLAVA